MELDGAARRLRSIAVTTSLVAAVTGLAAGGALYLLDAKTLSRFAFVSSVIVVLIPTVISTGRRLLRGEIGVDLIAVLAMAGALALGEYLAGAIIAVDAHRWQCARALRSCHGPGAN